MRVFQIVIIQKHGIRNQHVTGVQPAIAEKHVMQNKHVQDFTPAGITTPVTMEVLAMELSHVLDTTPVKDQHVIKQAPVKDILVIGPVEIPAVIHVADGHHVVKPANGNQLVHIAVSKPIVKPATPVKDLPANIAAIEIVPMVHFPPVSQHAKENPVQDQPA